MTFSKSPPSLGLTLRAMMVYSAVNCHDNWGRATEKKCNSQATLLTQSNLAGLGLTQGKDRLNEKVLNYKTGLRNDSFITLGLFCNSNSL